MGEVQSEIRHARATTTELAENLNIPKHDEYDNLPIVVEKNKANEQGKNR